ncbi:MAG: bi-domain-containing oxidoreductase [Opitutae bacterium]|nr:bi-domain-containing oxidoreductase [Opitutae bacterium]
MKQILQNLSSGETTLTEVPEPKVRKGHLLIRTEASLVSVGTEKMLVDFGKANLLDKARQQPDKVKQVLQKMKTDGIITTVEAVRAKLDQPLPLGYSNAGVVVEVGAGAVGFAVGDRVLSNGPHAGMVCVPQNLCAKVPDGVTPEQACFGVVTSIGLQGVRLLEPTLGERIVVTGLGLIGLLCVQILRANGCSVLGIDFDPKKCEQARRFGAETVDLSKGEDALVTAEKFSRGRGVDGVLITAATKSNEPVHQAAEMCRKRGRIILVGVVGLDLLRSDFYEKELSFQVSCSYGPGRYDSNYEDKGLDFPFGYVRWTEQRNFEAVLQLIESGSLDTSSLVTHQFSINEAVDAYEQLSGGNALGIVLSYPEAPLGGESAQRLVTLAPTSSAKPSKAVVGMIGAGNFTGQVLLPVLAKTGARLKTIISGAGVTGTHHGKKHGFEFSGTDAVDVFDDPEISLVMVTTRHNSHARQVLSALAAGKHVFVEKPLCMTIGELDEIEQAVRDSGKSVIVGFNRRFSPHTVKMKQLLDGINAPKSVVLTVNSGLIPPEHWTQDPEVGGGRIVGEACHFIDLCGFLVGARVKGTSINYLGEGAGALGDVASIQLSYEDGSIATVHYLSNGSKSFPKERVEVFSAGRVLQLDNFRQLTGYGWPGFKKLKTRSQAKGHAEEMATVIDWLEQGGTAPISFEDILETTRISLELWDQR